MAALPVRVSLAQRVPSAFRSSSYRLHDPMPCGCAPVAASEHGNSRLWIVAGLHAVGWALVYGETQRTWGRSRGRFHVENDWTGDALMQTAEAAQSFVGNNRDR